MNRKTWTRRDWLKTTTLGMGVLSTGQLPRIAAAAKANALDVGSALELAVDPRWIDRMSGLSLVQHAPVPREIVLTTAESVTDPPATLLGYMSVMKDGDLYRMYYRYVRPSPDQDGHEFFCYAESRDAIHWTKPNLGLFKLPGSNDGNAITEENMAFPGDQDSEHFPCISHNLRPFIDERPGVPKSERFKALAAGYNSGSPKAGYWALVSSDGIHWKKIQKDWVIDRKNWPHGSDSTPACAFWSDTEKKYVAYIRIRVNKDDPTKGQVGALRWIGRITSEDFIHWSNVTPMAPLKLEVDVSEVAARQVHHYTNETQQYFRNPNLLIATPTRYFEGTAFSKEELAKLSKEMQHHHTLKGMGYTDATLLTTRPGELAYRQPFAEAFLRPGIDVRNWSNRSTYPYVRFVPTGDHEMSFFAQHGIGSYRYAQRYSLRFDGFASVRAPLSGGEVLTKPIQFDGDRMLINYSTSGAGSIRVEMQDASGAAIPGYTLDDAIRQVGDSTEHTVRWKGGPDVGSLRGKTIRMRLVMHDADLFSFRFGGEA